MFNFNNNAEIKDMEMYKDMALNLYAYLDACNYLMKVPEEDEFWELVSTVGNFNKSAVVIDIEHNELCSNDNRHMMLTKFNNFVKSMS